MPIIKMPNSDSMIGAYTVCPKEVMQLAWLDKVGKYIDWTDRPGGVSVRAKILSVIVTDDEITIEVE